MIFLDFKSYSLFLVT